MNRLKEIDVARGIGIILVVLGHNILIGSRMHNYINSFHMPLFFMLSGYFFNLHEDTPYKFVKKISFRLIIPYAIFMVLIYPLFAMKYSDINNGVRNAIVSIKLQIPENNPMWFLTALFVVQLMYYILNRYIKNKYVIGLIIIILSFIGYFRSDEPKLFWSTDAACYYIIFFYIGHLLRVYNIIYKTRISIKEKKYIPVFIIALSLFLNISFYILSQEIYNNNMMKIHFIKFLVALILAIAGSFTVLTISCILSEEKILRYIGRNSMIILILHTPLREFIVSDILVRCKVWINGNNGSLGVFYTIVLIEISLICGVFINKYCPYILGQKNSLSEKKSMLI